jgi:hypothetical protein
MSVVNNGAKNGQAAAQQLAIGRMAFGVAGFLTPRLLGRIWIGSEGSSKRVAMVVRAFAVRDLALGLGPFLAMRNDGPVRGWLEAGLLCDSGDLLATLFSPSSRAKKALLCVTALTGIIGGAMALNEAT